MIVGIVGVPPWDVMKSYIEKGTEIIDLDEPHDNIPVRDIYLPNAYCSILKRVVSNIFSLREQGRLDCVLATVGKCKCDGMRNISSWLKRTTDIEIIEFENSNMNGHGYPISTSGLPLVKKMELITDSVFSPLPENINIEYEPPVCGFWGVPPFDFKILDLFPDRTHIYGWARCMENKTPADIELECSIDPDVPTLFFTQSFCQKSSFAFNLARQHGGLYVEVDKKLSHSTKAKIEAFLEFNVYRRREKT
ncbi:MAG TPA: hypothetical protein PLN69_05710 [bacterium]|nr:hypothetical protein [bacterium]